MNRFTLLTSIALFAVTTAACSAAPSEDGSEATSQDIISAPAPAPTPTPTPAAAMPGNLHWFRNAAERQALSRQSYRLATSSLEEMVSKRDAKDGAWAVIVDADETLIDNSQFQKESFEQSLAYSPERWTAWVNRKEAKALPGAKPFLDRVHVLGGKVVVISNRTTVECPDTESNLKALGLSYDAILCKADSSDKNARFKSVEEGTASPKLPALDVVLFVGDNIQDFPTLDQTAAQSEQKLSDFGTRFIMLPNPMYGSWEKNAQN